jgi:hypothetical protein
MTNDPSTEAFWKDLSNVRNALEGLRKALESLSKVQGKDSGQAREEWLLAAEVEDILRRYEPPVS